MADRPSKEAARLAFVDLTNAMAQYLATQGWTALVAGPARVQQQQDARPNHFELVITFTGGQTKTPAPGPPAVRRTRGKRQPRDLWGKR